jgi:AmiR/NasT family two-component response regulator
MQKPVILVADDDRLVLATVTSGLRDAGYSVLEASDGTHAVELCSEHDPQLAILDLRMPGMSGLEAAHEIQSKYDIPFMIFSAYGENQMVKDAVDNGALGYLIKPLDVTQMIPSIEAALERASEIKRLKESEFHLNRALNTGRETSTAIGIVMERHRLSSQEAFERLRQLARSQRRKLWEVSAEIVRSADILNISSNKKDS